MTREEAIKIIDCYDIGFYDLSGEKIPADKLADAFDMAIEALSVVRCKDCRYRELDGETTHFYWCRINERSVDDDDFCAWGERKGGDNNEID